ncbi:MAG: glycosyltransferase, partial [Nitrososphaerota archaeon]
FAIANNIAFSKRDNRSKYIALINDDLVPEPDSLSKLIEFMETNESVGGVQGKILTWDSKRIDSAGCVLTQDGNTYAIGRSLPANSCNKIIPITYSDGAFSVYRVKAIENCGGLFLPYFFMYGDDYELGIRLWRCGYKIVYVPIIAGCHYRSATINSAKHIPTKYWVSKAMFSVQVMYDDLWFIHLLPRFLTTPLRSLMRVENITIRGFVDGIFLGLKLRKKAKELRGAGIREPRIKIDIFSQYCELIGLFLSHGWSASEVIYFLMCRRLGVNYPQKTS